MGGGKTCWEGGGGTPRLYIRKTGKKREKRFRRKNINFSSAIVFFISMDDELRIRQWLAARKRCLFFFGFLSRKQS